MNASSALSPPTAPPPPIATNHPRPSAPNCSNDEADEADDDDVNNTNHFFVGHLLIHISAKDKVVSRKLIGYALNSGGGWIGDSIIADWQQIGTMSFTSKGSLSPMRHKGHAQHQTLRHLRVGRDSTPRKQAQISGDCQGGSREVVFIERLILPNSVKYVDARTVK